MDKKKFDAHPLWDTMEQVRNAATRLGEIDHCVDAVEHLCSTAGYIRRFQKSANILLFSSKMLDSMKNCWESIDSYVRYQLDNPSSDYSNQIMGALEGVVEEASKWPQPWDNTPLTKSMTEDLSRYQRDVEESRGRQRKKAEALAGRLREIEAQRDALEKDLVTLRSEFENQERRIASLVDSQISSFDTAQRDRDKNFKDWLDERKNDFDSKMVVADGSLSVKVAEAQMLLAGMEGRRDEVEKIASDTTSALLARDFGSYSNRQFWASLIMYILGFSLVVLAGVMLFFSVKSIAPDVAASWQWVSMKFTLTATIVGGATVCFTLGNRIYRQSTSSKRVELELRALGPFLADLESEEARIKVKSMFADRSFGHAFDVDSSKPEGESVNINLLSQLIDQFVKLIPKNQ